MSRYRINDQFGMYFITMTVIDWVDVFTRKIYKDILIDSLRYCQDNKGLIVFGYVIMSNHVHLIVKADGNIPLSDILRDFKKYTATQILHQISTCDFESRKEWMLYRFRYRGQANGGDRVHQFWDSDNHPIELYSLPVMGQKLHYIHQNPVEAGWVSQGEHYLYSSASNYTTGEGILNVTLIDFPLSYKGMLNL